MTQSAFAGTCVLAMTLSSAEFPVAEDERQAEAVSAGTSRWYSIGAEFRNRTDAGSGFEFDPAHRHFYTLSRIRISSEIRPWSWLRMNIQVQDSRALAGGDGDVREGMSNVADFRDAYIELGHAEGGKWQFRFGRQALNLGDERLIGSDGEWCNRGRRFDGALAILRHADWEWNLFSGTMSQTNPFRLDGPQSRDRLTGVYGTWLKQAWHLKVEPYLLLTRTDRGFDPDDAEVSERMQLQTPGTRVMMDLPANSWFASEMALQFGRGGGDHPTHVRAWAGSWSAGHRLADRATAPELGFGYSFASGSREAEQSEGSARGTFDDLFPAGFNGTGALDPFAWRNLKDIMGSLEWRPVPRWRLASETHGYWLATKQDGLYVDDGPFVCRRAGASSSRLGVQVNAIAQYSRSKRWAVSFGYARLFAGPYLQEAGLGVSANSAFVAWTLRM